MGLTTYVDGSGAYVNNVTPLSAANMNNIRNFLIAAGAMWDSNVSYDGNGMQTVINQKINTAGVVLNGSTAGTATLYQPQRGTWKVVVVILNGFRNGGASNQDIALPVPFTSKFQYSSGDFDAFQFLVSGVAQSGGVLTSLSAGGGGVTGTSTFHLWCIGEVASGCDTLRFTSGNATARSGTLIMQGV